MARMISADRAAALVRRARCAACGGRLVVVDQVDGERSVACLLCGREVASVVRQRPDAVLPDWRDARRRA